MQSYYSNPHQLQAAAVAAAAAAAAGGQRLPFQPPFGGLHDPPGRSTHVRGLHPTTENSSSICGSGQQPPGSADEINESEMDSDIMSDNDDDDPNEIESDRTSILSKLKRKDHDDHDDIEKTLKGQQTLSSSSLSSSAHKRLRESRGEENGCSYGKLEEDGGGSGLEEDQLATQTEIKVQRPLGLLAQHGLSMKMAKAHQGPQSLQFDQDFGRDDESGVGGGSGQWSKVEHKSPDGIDDEVAQDTERDKAGSLNGLDFTNHMSLMDRRFMPSPPPLGSPTGLDPNKPPSTPSSHHWTFEEQFKQLYEMSPESKRKEFLDDLFTFMQKRGTPVNRIPIMAKQTLDLYELFRLVVSKGGLVEVINKKLWREITKGLNLPSSITSAAFTLRTQYMKYLYPYECDRLKLSTLAELQSAIDGNRREGRRPGYGYDFSPIPTMLSTPPTPHLNGPMHPLASSRPPTGLSPKDDDRSLLHLSSSHGHLRSLAAEHDVRGAMEVATRAMEDLVNKRMEEASRAAAIASGVMTSSGGQGQGQGQGPMNVPGSKFVDDLTTTTPLATSCKRPPMMFDDERFLAHMGMHSTHIKLNSTRSNGRLEYDSSMVVSMEINGMMYQGVLFAQHPRRI